MQKRLRIKSLLKESGFTLVELLVVMSIFMGIMIITADAFKTIVNQSSQQSKSVESQIQGIVGLELLRSDVEQAGFGLPWSFQSTTPAVGYKEALNSNTIPASFWPSGTNPSSFNDAPYNPPRAIVSGRTTFNEDTSTTPPTGSAYLVIKSTVAATNDTAKRWTTVSFAGGTKFKTDWGSKDRDLTGTEMVTVIKNSLNRTPPTRQLMATSTTVFSSTFGTYSTLIKNPLDGDNYSLYGVDPSKQLRMPFNRADFYVKRPTNNMPASCMNSPGVGVLYKSTVIQGPDSGSGGGLTLGSPLLDCVADMQVVYGLDTSGAGIVNQHTITPLATAEDIRSQLKEVRIYILAHEGKRDRFYTYPSETITVGEDFGGTVQGRVFNLKDRLGNDYKYFRWKVFTIVLRPKNIVQ